MPYNIYQTTAEEIIGATDAIVQKKGGATAQMIADFLTNTLQNAQNAANMAVELGLVQVNANHEYFPLFPYANYIITSTNNQKASVLRFILEEYEPYKLFKIRLKLLNSATDAANQTRAIFNLGAQRQEILHTLISLGTYSNSLKTQGAGRYTPATGNDFTFIKVIEEVVQNRQTAELKIRERLGEDICQWLNAQDVLNPLITGYQRAGDVQNDQRAPIVHSGNAFESFLVQVANHFGDNIVGANGINAKMARIRQANHLTTKHQNISNYLGHVRNACDHGIDLEINHAWSISEDTGIEYVHICLTAIRSIYDCIQGNYIL